MQFESKYGRGIAEGTQTLTFRRWKRAQVIAGNTYRTAAGRLFIEDVSIVAPDTVTDVEAAKAGYPSGEGLLADLRGTTGLPLYRVQFRLAEGPDPRDELAASGDLSAAELAEITRKLGRLDRASAGGTWTRATLELIAANPAVRAGELAPQLGQELLDFKLNVRKLKNLGLTISLGDGVPAFTTRRGVAEVRCEVVSGPAGEILILVNHRPRNSQEPRLDNLSRGRSNPLTVLSNQQFKLLFIGTTLSMLAFGMMQVVQGAVAFDLTGKNGSVGFVYLGQGFAMLLLSPVGGALSDRVSKKRMLTLAQFVIGAMFGVVGVLIATDLITIYLLATGALVLGIMFSMMGPTRQAWVGDLLSGEEMAKGVALQQLMMNVTRIVGPLTAGVLIAAPVGTSGTYFVMAGLFGAVVLTLMLMEPTPPRTRAVKTSVREDLFEGFGYIWRTPEVRLLAFVFVGVVLTAFSYQTMMPGYLVNTLHHPTSHLGILFTTTAIGGIIVNVVLAARPGRTTPGVMLGFGAGLSISLALLALAPTFVAALCASTLIGASSSGFQMLNNVNLMKLTEPAYLGRVMAVTMMAFGVNSIASFPIGLIADQVGERAALAGLSCACMTVVVLGVVAMRASALRKPALGPAEATLSTPPSA